MNFGISFLLALAQTVLLVGAAPLAVGVVRTTKARLLGRRGPPLLQPYRDLRRLLLKESLVAERASATYIAAPSLVFAATLAAAMLVPVLTTATPLRAGADLIAVMGLLALARFSLTLSALDNGTAFAGIGVSRELMVAAVAEPAMLLVILTWALLVGSTSLPAMTEWVLGDPPGLRASLALALVAMIMVALAENGRMPADNPATHLELTMVHEAMILDLSGRHLALIEAASMVKLAVTLSLIIALFAPWGIVAPSAVGVIAPGALGFAVAAFLGKLLGLSVLLGAFEVSLAKMRVFRVPEFIGGALLMGLLSMVLLFITKGF